EGTRTAHGKKRGTLTQRTCRKRPLAQLLGDRPSHFARERLHTHDRVGTGSRRLPETHQVKPGYGGVQPPRIRRPHQLAERPHRRTEPRAPHELIEARLRQLIQRFEHRDRKSTRLNSSHVSISYAVFCV